MAFEGSAASRSQLDNDRGFWSYLRMRAIAAALAAAFLALAAPAGAAPIVRQGSDAGGSAVNTTAARDAFRADLGGGTTAGADGSFGGVRREVNWDDVPPAKSAPNNFQGE